MKINFNRLPTVQSVHILVMAELDQETRLGITILKMQDRANINNHVLVKNKLKGI